MKIITVANNKGGVGKTTFVWNLANVLTHNGKKVLIIDLDDQISHLESDRTPLMSFTSKLPPRQKTHEYEQMCAKYDYVLIDSAPNITTESQNAFILSNHVLLISDLNFFSFQGILKIINDYREACNEHNLKFNIEGIILNSKQNNRTSRTFEKIFATNKLTKKLVVEPYIPRWTVFEQSINFKKSLYHLKNNKSIAIMELICQELKNRKIL